MPTTPPPITALPAPPDPNDRSTFNPRAYPWSVAQQTFATEVSAVATNVKGNADDAVAAAGTATTQAGNANTSAAVAAAFAASAINAPGTQATSTTSVSVTIGTKSIVIQAGKAFAVGQRAVLARTSNPAICLFGRIDAHNSGTGAVTFEALSAEGASGPFTDWTFSLSPPGAAAPPEVKQRTITGNDTVVASDRQKIIVFTGSADATLAFTAAGTLGDGFFCQVQNATQYNLTLDPSGSEQVDGVASYPMLPNEVREVRCNGTAFASLVLVPYSKLWSASGTWPKTPGYTEVEGYAHGAGQGGRRGAAGVARNGGPGGARAPFRFALSQLSATEAVVVGSGGAAATTDNTNGGAGGDSSFHGVVGQGASGNSPGSAYGDNNNPATKGAAPASAEESQKNAYLGGAAADSTGFYGSTVWGGGSGASITAANAMVAGRPSIFGGQGGTTNAAGTAPTAGQVPGGGGGASTNGTNSGPGARGEVFTRGVI